MLTSSSDGRFPAPDEAVTKAEDRIIKDLGSSTNPAAKSKQGDKLVKAMAGLNVSDVGTGIPLPVRPAYGHTGTQVVLWANYFKVDMQGGVIYTYNITVKSTKIAGSDFADATTNQHDNTNPAGDAEESDVTGRKLKAIIQLAIDQLRVENPAAVLATEYKSKLVSLHKIERDSDTLEVSYCGEEGTKRAQTYWVKLTKPHEASLDAVLDYVKTMSDPSDPRGCAFPKFSVPVDALGAILGLKARNTPDITPVGSARFFLCPAIGREEAFLSRKLETIRGYFQSIRLATSRLLINVNVTHGVFKTPHTVAQLCKDLNLAPFGRNAQLDNRQISELGHLHKFLAKTRFATEFMDKDGKLRPAKKTIFGLARGAGMASGEVQMSLAFGGPREVRFNVKVKEGETTVMNGKPPGMYTVEQYLKWSKPKRRRPRGQLLTRSRRIPKETLRLELSPRQLWHGPKSQVLSRGLVHNPARPTRADQAHW